MKWRTNDIKQYVQAKEYIDTALIPLIPFSLSNDQQIKELVFQKELMDIYVNHIEQQLKGRIFLLPEYYYLKDDKINEELTKLNRFTKHVHNQPFKYTFLITFDREWRKVIKELDDVELLWIPSMKEGDLSQKETQKMIQSQVKEIEQLIMDSWN